MTNRPSTTSLSKRIWHAFVGLVVVIAILIGVKFLGRALWRSTTQPRIIAAIKATFPNFCTDGQVLAELYVDPLEILFTDHDKYWPVTCDSWTQYENGVHLIATLVDVDHCTTIRPFFGMTSDRKAEFEAINKSNGQKLAFCP